jgi:hypothetical protein
MCRWSKEKVWRNGQGLQACQAISSSTNSMSPYLRATKRKLRERGERKLPRPRGLPGYHSWSTARAPPLLSRSTPDTNHTLQRLCHSHVHRPSRPCFTVHHITYVSHTTSCHTTAKEAECILRTAITGSGLQALPELTSLHYEEGGAGVAKATQPHRLPHTPPRQARPPRSLARQKGRRSGEGELPRPKAS